MESYGVIRNCILVKPKADGEERKTKAGIVLPDEMADSVPFRGEVLAVSAGLKEEGLEVGDEVLYVPQGRTYACIKFKPTVESEELVNVPDTCVLAFIKREGVEH